MTCEASALNVAATLFTQPPDYYAMKSITTQVRNGGRQLSAISRVPSLAAITGCVGRTTPMLSGHVQPLRAKWSKPSSEPVPHLISYYMCTGLTPSLAAPHWCSRTLVVPLPSAMFTSSV